MPRCCCRLLPHGCYPLVPAVVASIAWAASLSQDGCDYSKVSGAIVQDVTGSDVVPYIEVGFSAYREPIYNADVKEFEQNLVGDCLAYPESISQDVFWKTSTIFAFLSLVLGGGGALFLWFSTCFVFSPGTWRWAGYEVFGAFLFQCLSFLWFRTELCKNNYCELFYGSKMNIAAASLFLFSSLLVICRYPTPKPVAMMEPVENTAPEISLTPRSSSSLELPIEGDPDATLPTGESSREEEQQALDRKESDSELI